MIFSKKLKKTAASVLALVMVFAMSTGAFAAGALTDAGDETLASGYYTVKVNYEVVNDLPADAQISIIALSGKDTVDYTGNTANNVLWIDQQAATAKTGSFEFQVDANKAGEGFYVKSGVTGGESISGYVTIATQDPTPSLSSDAKLGSLTVDGTAVTPNHETGAAAIELTEAKTSVKIVATANDSKAKSVVIAGANDEGNVAVTAGQVNNVTITVTAEDNTTKTYILAITVPASQGGDDGDDPDPNAPVIPEYDPAQPEKGGLTVTTSEDLGGKAPLGVENGKIVRISGIENLPVDDETGVPTKTPYVGNQEFYYTSYDTNGDGTPEIKFVTIITDNTVTAGDVTWKDEAPQQMIYGNINRANDNVEINISDVALLTQYALGKVADTLFDKLTLDINGDGEVNISDVSRVTVVALDPTKIPDVASK